MKKVVTIIILTIFLGACSSEKSSEDIKNEIFEYKEKIKLLEKQLQNENVISNSKLVKVKVVEAKKTKIKHSFTVTGGVRAENMAYVSPEMNGQIKHIYVKEGQFVKKGQLLVALNSEIIQNSIRELKTGLAFAKVMYEKQKTLWEQKIGKEIDFLKAENQKESIEAKLATVNAQLRMSKIYAPFSGVVDVIYSKKGEMATPGRPLIDFVNLNAMEAGAEVSEKYLPYIKKGDVVKVKFPTYPDLIKETTISQIGNIINPANRTFKIIVKINNTDKKIKPNMIAELVLTDYVGEDIAVPSIIIKKDRKGQYVFIAKNKEGKLIAEKRYIETGINTGDKTIIKKGVNVGEKVITEGYSLVSTGVELSF